MDMQDVNLDKGSCSGTIEAGGHEDVLVKTYWTGTEQDQAVATEKFEGNLAVMSTLKLNGMKVDQPCC